jgi:predicted nucleic acid-binding Zn ribbon protein
VQSFRDDPLTECPNCHGHLRKVFGNIGIAFKGPGFYRTDSRTGTKKAKPAETKSAESTSADSKPAASKTSETKTSESSSTAKTKSDSAKSASSAAS